METIVLLDCFFSALSSLTHFLRLCSFDTRALYNVCYGWNGLIKAPNLCRHAVYCWVLCLVMQNSRNKSIELRNTTSVRPTTKKREKRNGKLDTQESRKLKSGTQWQANISKREVTTAFVYNTDGTECFFFFCIIQKKETTLNVLFLYNAWYMFTCHDMGSLHLAVKLEPLVKFMLVVGTCKHS